MREIFKEFLAEAGDSKRNDFNNIYYFDGHIWFTNGRIMISAISEPVDYAKNEKPKWGDRAVDHFGKYKETEHLIPFPIIDNLISNKINCSECYGKGKIETDEKEGEVCSVCGGDGDCECPDCGTEHVCGKCNGRGKKDNEIIYGPCLHCKGTGKVDAFNSVILENRKIKYFYYKLITDNLTNTKYSIFHSSSYLDAIYFCADNGIEGMVMPTTAEEDPLSA